MSRKRIALFMLCAVLACSGCDVKKAGSSSREGEFQKKRLCAEFGIALDRRKDEAESEGVAHGVRAEWCFSKELNTCVYSSVDEVVVAFDPNTNPRIVAAHASTIDLLTNRTLISIERVKRQSGQNLKAMIKEDARSLASVYKWLLRRLGRHWLHQEKCHLNALGAA